MATATVTPSPGTPKPKSFLKSSASSSGSYEGRFIPGTILAERYRVIAMLGRGGMGEVYRADDLRLQQSVALKFLPEATAHDPVTLERFHNEVRIARRISHPNVCRIYDIGEADGLVFLSMEYVDGEDLGSLLRRIGRLPSDKALEIARKLCAGLAAAHDKGVLHRDLKPANIMLNSEGEVVIMDFGLADLAEHIPHEQVRYGTPAYMAPEQLAGKEVTGKSDIYALGLVLYEIFTGKRAFQADTLAEIVRTRVESPAPTNPSTIVRDLDPGVESVILRCLESDPAMRPVSVLAVAAALPGGDPLAAALAAGETPSPQMVAAAGEVEGLAPRVAVPCIVAILLALGACFWIGVRLSALPKMNLSLPPDVLTHKAQEIASQLGYAQPAVDSDWGFWESDDFLRYVKTQSAHPDWDKVFSQPPALIHYWYRSSPRPMVVTEFQDSYSLNSGLVGPDAPPNTISGMIEVELDPQGRLLSFGAIPPQKQDAPLPPKSVDWKPIFTLAGLDFSQFQPTEPLWNSLAASDTRLAWAGVWPGSGVPLRVEAGALGGRPVFFSLIGPWSEPNRQVQEEKPSDKASGIFVATVGGIILFASAWLGYRNARKKRADLSAAWRIGTFYFIVDMLVWVLRAHFVAGIGSFGLLLLAICGSLFLSAIVAVLYLALEPYVRRHWPQTIISWTRLLHGQWRDPLVAKDVLIGILEGLAINLILYTYGAILARLGDSLIWGDLSFLLGARHVMGNYLVRVLWEFQGTLIFFFVLFLLRVLLRKRWVAAVVFVAIWVFYKSLGAQHLAVHIPTMILLYGSAAFVMVRFGLIALISGFFVTDLLVNLPMTSDFSSWFIGPGIFAYAMVLVIALWAFHTSLAGQKLWKEALFD